MPDVTPYMPISKTDLVEAKKVISQFKQLKSDEEIFYDMCFTICAPMCTFVVNKKTNDMLIENDFFNKDVSDEKMKEIVRPVRYYKKARFLKVSKDRFSQVLDIIKDKTFKDSDKRDKVQKLVVGFGKKAASHFLRNCGAEDLAIWDVHTLRYIDFEGTPNDRQYIEQEEKFKKHAKEKYSVTAGVLDAVIWKIGSNTAWEDFDK